MKIVSFNPAAGMDAKKHRKEKQFTQAWALIDLTTGEVSVEVRTYGTGTTKYACVWTDIKITKGCAVGSASVNGYLTNAVAKAFKSAGIEFDNLAGRTDTQVETALTVLADKIGLKKFMVYNAHA